MSIKSLFKKITNIFLSLLIIILIGLIITIFLDKYNNEDKVLSIHGYSIFRVATGSMVPTLNIGDYILIKKNSEYEIGDIITYQLEENYITHRVIKKNNNTIITKGDANNIEDNPISTSDIKGKFIMKLTLFDIIYNKYVIGGFIIIILLINLLNWCLKKKEDKGKHNYEKKEK